MKWYREAVGYEIYPYSFMDSNGDGYGDLRGVISKLDYLKDLGISLIWLCPVFRSPRDDNGYDVSDFYSVDPVLGTNEDLEELIRTAHEKGIRVIMDLILNHVSSAHEWFRKAIADPESPYHDYFIFRRPKTVNGEKLPPNNWMGFFSESVWTYVPELDEYYFHIFSSSMPDLNWENEALRQEMYRVARHYLDMGADGFRMDAIAHLAKDQSFEDSPYDTGPVLDTSKFSNRDRLFDYLSEFRREVLDRYPDVLTVGEVGGEADTRTAVRYADRENGSLTMVFNFDTCWENGAFGSVRKTDEEIVTDVVNLKTLFKKWYDACHERCEMPLYWLNHDHPRLVSQYGSRRQPEKSAKMLAAILLFLYGTPFIYQGEELGMTNADYEDIADFCSDVGTLNFVRNSPDIPEDVMLRFLRRTSRVNARTPMQWTSGKNAGFTEGEPYMKVNGNHGRINAADEEQDPESVLRFYKKAIALRKELNAFITEGTTEFPDLQDEDLFIVRHRLDEEEILLIANMKETERTQELQGAYRVLLSNNEFLMDENRLIIGPLDIFLLKKDEKGLEKTKTLG